MAITHLAHLSAEARAPQRLLLYSGQGPGHSPPLLRVCWHAPHPAPDSWHFPVNHPVTAAERQLRTQVSAAATRTRFRQEHLARMRLPNHTRDKPMSLSSPTQPRSLVSEAYLGTARPSQGEDFWEVEQNGPLKSSM